MSDDKDRVVEDRDYQQPVNVGTVVADQPEVGTVDGRKIVVVGAGSGGSVFGCSRSERISPARRSIGLAVAAMALAGSMAMPSNREFEPSRRRKPERVVPRVFPKEWYMDEGGHYKKTPVTEDDHAAVSAAEAKRQRKAKKLAATQSKES
ncbi:hypothetical protein Amme1_00089 [Pseudomonas phage vB_PpuM-Amme-1]